MVWCSQSSRQSGTAWQTQIRQIADVSNCSLARRCPNRQRFLHTLWAIRQSSYNADFDMLVFMNQNMLRVSTVLRCMILLTRFVSCLTSEGSRVHRKTYLNRLQHSLCCVISWQLQRRSRRRGIVGAPTYTLRLIFTCTACKTQQFHTYSASTPGKIAVPKRLLRRASHLWFRMYRRTGLLCPEDFRRAVCRTDFGG